MNSGIILGVIIIALVLTALRYGSVVFGGNKKAEKELIQLCRGDKAMVERLIAREVSRNPSSSRMAAIKAAVYSLKRDNH